MKAKLVGNKQAGFSTLEIVIAFGIMIIALAGATSANFAAQYSRVTAEAANEAVYRAKTKLEDLRALAKEDFYSATTSPLAEESGYFAETFVTDFSSCSKFLTVRAHSQVESFPTTTTALSTNITNQPEAVKVGEDCLLKQPTGKWANTALASSADFTPGVPTSIDVLNGIAYVTLDRPPYLKIISSHGLSPITSTTCAGCNSPFNAVDVARNISTGRIYAYIAATTTQLQIVDVTDPLNPVLIASSTLSGVTTGGTDSQGWRIAFYDRKAYIMTRFISPAVPEFHIFDVSDPYAPVEIGRTRVGTSVYATVVRDQMYAGTLHRFAYFATTHKQKEVMILDLTDPAHIGSPALLDLPEAGCALADPPDATALSLSGTTLWVGRERSPSCPTLPTLYAVSVADPLHPVLTPTQIVTGTTIAGLRVSGNLAYLQTASQAAAPGTGLLDIDEKYIYAVRAIKGVEVWSIAPTDVAGPVDGPLGIKKLSSYSPLTHFLQIFQDAP